MMRYNSFSRGFDFLEFLILFVLIAVIVVAIIALCIQLFRRSRTNYQKSVLTSPAIPQPVQERPYTLVQNETISAADDEDEIAAVIAAAIQAYTESSEPEVEVKNISYNDRPKTISNWAMCGRLEAFQSRTVIRK